MSMPGLQRMLDAPELNTDIGFIVVADFITEVVNAFLPKPCRGASTARHGPSGRGLEAGRKNRPAERGQDFRRDQGVEFLFGNPQAYYPDLGIGTVAMWIARPHPAQPIVCSAIPLRELEIDLGPYGEIDTRFAVRYTRNHYVRELVGEEIWDKMDPEMKKHCGDKPTDRTQIGMGILEKMGR